MTQTIVGTRPQTVTEPKTVEELDAQVKDLRAQRRSLKEAEQQREVLRPQIQKRVDRLGRERADIRDALSEAEKALDDIDAGRLTDYHVRAPRKPKKPAQTEQ